MIFDHPWLGGLFGESKVIDLWSAERQLDRYRAFEVALAKALEACGHVPVRHGHLAAEAIENAEIDMASLAASTTRDGLPIPDFVRQLRSQAGEFQTAIHTGATSVLWKIRTKPLHLRIAQPIKITRDVPQTLAL